MPCWLRLCMTPYSAAAAVAVAAVAVAVVAVAAVAVAAIPPHHQPYSNS